jgi:RimJ/RimL family protein N-acetyltransferase
LEFTLRPLKLDDALANDRGERIALSIVDDNNIVMGRLDFAFTNNRCEVRFEVGANFRKRGIAKAALGGAIAFFEQQLTKVLFFAYVDSENIPSQRVLAACGFKRDAGHDKSATEWYLERANHLIAGNKP